MASISLRLNPSQAELRRTFVSSQQKPRWLESQRGGFSAEMRLHMIRTPCIILSQVLSAYFALFGQPFPAAFLCVDFGVEMSTRKTGCPAQPDLPRPPRGSPTLSKRKP